MLRPGGSEPWESEFSNGKEHLLSSFVHNIVAVSTCDVGIGHCCRETKKLLQFCSHEPIAICALKACDPILC
jgi:hypothetical protein